MDARTLIKICTVILLVIVVGSVIMATTNGGLTPAAVSGILDSGEAIMNLGN